MKIKGAKIKQEKDGQEQTDRKKEKETDIQRLEKQNVTKRKIERFRSTVTILYKVISSPNKLPSLLSSRRALRHDCPILNLK